MKDPSYRLSTMQTKLASDNASQVDAATAFIAVDANALGRAVLLWQGCMAAPKPGQPHPGGKPPRGARFFLASPGGADSKL
jgi:hypothetical protein